MSEQNTQLVLERNDWIVSLIRAAKGLPLDVDAETLPENVRQGVEMIQQLFTRATHSEWRMMTGDWREELVSLHDHNGHIVSGLTVSQARALIDAHGGVKPEQAAKMTAAIDVEASFRHGVCVYGPAPETKG